MITHWKTLPVVLAPRIAGIARAAILLVCSAIAVAVITKVV